MLLTQFGPNREAIQCLKECIMLAQEGGDRVYLDFAQLWLYFLHENGMQAVDAQVASKLDAPMSTNLSAALQSLVRKSALSGCQSSKLLLDLLHRSDTLKCQYSITNLLAMNTAKRSAFWTIYSKIELYTYCREALFYWNMKKQTAFWLGL